jgi:hypothetical protein
MKHKRIERLIQKSLDREISAAEENVLKKHLSQCNDCRRLYEELVETEQILGTLIEFYPRYDFNERVLKKLGFKKVFAWKRVSAILSGAWFAALVFLTLSPLPGKLFGEFLTSFPAIVRFVDKIHIIVTSLSHVLLPFTKDALTSIHPITGLIFSIIITYLFGKILHPVRKLEGNIKSPFKEQDLLTG